MTLWASAGAAVGAHLSRWVRLLMPAHPQSQIQRDAHQ
ncbi:hypothetical protein GLA29479_3804 [Lysobacter antibioticus]|nr:hypothetical protein GLA29479_3804 [Lysobacter antibioticus]